MVPTSNEPELMRALLADKDVPCPSCGYNLRNLVGRVCPECSTLVALSIAPVDPLWQYRRLVMWALGLHGLGGVLAGGWTMLSWLSAPAGPYSIAMNVSMIGSSLTRLVPGIASLWVLVKLIRACRARREDARPALRAVVCLCWIFIVQFAASLVLYFLWFVLGI